MPAYKLPPDLATAPSLARGRLAGGRKLLHLALRQQRLEPGTLLRPRLAGLRWHGLHEPRRHLRVDVRALGPEAIQLGQRPIRYFDFRFHRPAERVAAVAPGNEVQVAHVDDLARLQREARVAGAVELAAGVVVHRLDAAARILAAVGHHVILTRIELHFGHCRLGEGAHVGDRDALVATVTVPFAHAQQHGNVDASRARCAYPHDGTALRVCAGGGGQAVVDARGLRAAGEQHAGDGRAQSVPRAFPHPMTPPPTRSHRVG